MAAERGNREVDSEDQPGFTWFKFYFNDWLTDPNVRAMTAAELGIYITLLAVQARDNWLPADDKHIVTLLKFDRRVTGRFLETYGNLFVTLRWNSSKRANAKLWNLQVKSGKIAAPEITEEIENKTQKQKDIFIPPTAGKKSKHLSSARNLNPEILRWIKRMGYEAFAGRYSPEQWAWSLRMGEHPDGCEGDPGCGRCQGYGKVYGDPCDCLAR